MVLERDAVELRSGGEGLLHVECLRVVVGSRSLGVHVPRGPSSSSRRPSIIACGAVGVAREGKAR